jgi:hypothetical protein
MAGSQFATPPHVVPSRPSRRFTLEQANKSLPLVRRIVGDVVRVSGEAASLQDEIQTLPEGKMRVLAAKELDHRVARLNELVEELGGIGVELKDYQSGLVDFIGRHEGHDVYLCWRLGEEKIAFWHELSAGVAGRQPVSLLKESE